MLNQSAMRGWFLLTVMVPLCLPVLTRAAAPETATATEVGDVSGKALSLRLRGLPMSRGNEGLAQPLDRAVRPLCTEAVAEDELVYPTEVTDLPPGPDEQSSGNSEAAFWVAAGALAVAGCVSARKQSTKRVRKDR